jgi:hypothetical protein
MTMQALLLAAASSIAAPRIPRPVSFIGKLILVPILLLMLAALAMEGGAWRKSIMIAGPFAAETSPPQHSLILIVPDQGSVLWWQQPLNSDSLEKPYESRLRLAIDGREMGPAHTKLEQIRNGETGGFSHWESGVIFSLPPGLKNAPDTIATLRYNVEPRPWVILVLLLASLVLGWLCLQEIIKKLAHRYWQPNSGVRRSAEWLLAALFAAPYLILFGLCCLGLAGCVLFVGSSLYALIDGWALPTRAPIRWFPVVEWAARQEPYFGQLLLMLAGFGTLTTWLAFLQKANPSLEYEARLRRFLRYCGFPIATCAFVLCISAMWEGMIRPGDLQWANVAGLVPLTDADSHLASTYYGIREGIWTEFAARRPLAAAFREVLLIASNSSSAVMLILQAALLALAACVASYALMVWRGVWSGLALFGLTYIYVRSFAPTPLTESLGLFWALLSIPFFVEAFRRGSYKPALVGFAMTVTALMIRMGSMFTVPALLVWLVWQFGCGFKSKVRVAALAFGVLLAVFGVTYLLQKAYGPPGAGTGSNFAYTLCGLTIGTTWDGCPTRLAEQQRPLQGDEAAISKRLYAFAWENFQAEPEIFFRRLTDGVEEFIKDFPNVIWRGYDPSFSRPGWLFRGMLVTISAMGLVCLAMRRAKAVEISFWGLLWTSVLASTAIVYFDDGARVLAASHPLIALFFAMGLVNPGIGAIETQKYEHRFAFGFGALALLLSTLLFVSVPWAAHYLYGYRYTLDLKPAANEAFVYGGREMSGLLVVTDGEPLRAKIASVHFSDFEVMLKNANVFKHFLGRPAPVPPFGLAFAPRLERGVSDPDVFLVPPEVLERHDVELWHFKLGFDRGAAEVTSAEPIQR